MEERKFLPLIYGIIFLGQLRIYHSKLVLPSAAISFGEKIKHFFLMFILMKNIFATFVESLTWNSNLVILAWPASIIAVEMMNRNNLAEFSPICSNFSVGNDAGSNHLCVAGGNFFSKRTTNTINGSWTNSAKQTERLKGPKTPPTLGPSYQKIPL